MEQMPTDTKHLIILFLLIWMWSCRAVQYTYFCNVVQYGVDSNSITHITLHKKRSHEMQTLHAGCTKVEPKKFAPPQTPFLGEWEDFSQLEMVTTFT